MAKESRNSWSKNKNISVQFPNGESGSSWKKYSHTMAPRLLFHHRRCCPFGGSLFFPAAPGGSRRTDLTTNRSSPSLPKNPPLPYSYPTCLLGAEKKGRLAAPLGLEVEGSYISLFFWMTLGVKKIRSSFFVLSVSWFLKSQPKMGTFISQGIPWVVSSCSVS